jgi:hypothetical protein
LAGATPLAVNNVAVEIPLGPGIPHAIETDFDSPQVLLSGTAPGNPDIGLPGYAGDTIFLKFRSEYLADIEAINSFSITITFQDNADDGGETARVAYALPDSNLILADSPFVKLGKNNDPNPDTITLTLTPDQIAQALPGISDNNFRVQIMRETGDFLVTGASAQLDVTYFSTPEPATLLLLLPAVGVIALRRRA